MKTDFYYLVFSPFFISFITPDTSLVFTTTSLPIPVYHFTAVTKEISTRLPYSFKEWIAVCLDKKLFRLISFIVTCNILLLIVTVRS